MAILSHETIESMKAANFSVEQSSVDGIAVVRLSDAAHATEIAIAVSVGNMAYRFRSAGEEILYFPYASAGEWKAKPAFCGIPFLAPWGNRLDGDAYWANGKRYLLNAKLGNLRRDAHQAPIHGLLNFSPYWEVVETGADETSAWTTSRLEFARRPDLMAQFPFAHTLTMTHRLRGGELEVETAIENHSAEPLPVAVGHHPYFCLPGVARDEWRVHLAARDHLALNDMQIPTGDRRPVELSDPYPLKGAVLDDVFSNLVRDADGRARFWVDGGGRRITVTYGPKYTVAIVYAPAGHDYVCFEPMSAITNAFNLAHAGVYGELQSVAPGEVWRESFWISYEAGHGRNDGQSVSR
jgi:aldose 1-epimerase